MSTELWLVSELIQFYQISKIDDIYISDLLEMVLLSAFSFIG